MDVKDLGITINHLLRYGYGGLLTFVVCGVLWPDETSKTLTAIGGAVASLSAVAIGATVYVMYRSVLGDPFLYPFCNWLHRTLEPRWGYAETGGVAHGYNCTVHALEQRFAVKRDNATDAFRVVRDLFNPELARRFEIQHSEIHLLYITFFVLGTAALYLVVTQFVTTWDKSAITIAFSALAVISLTAAVTADLRLCRRECAQLLLLDRAKVEALLNQAELRSG